MAAPAPAATATTWAIAIHGGAGVINADDPEWIRRGLKGMRRALRAGAAVLSSGGSALDASVAAVVALEDDPLFNAGRGSVMTRGGRHELEASVMVCSPPRPPPAAAAGAPAAAPAPPPYADGGDGSGALRCGAAALLTTVKNPVQLARAVMDRTPHTFLAGSEAEALAARLGLDRVPSNDAFATEARRAQWRRWKEREQGEAAAASLAAAPAPAPRADEIVQGPRRGRGGGGGGGEEEEGATGTVGAVALDAAGALAAATSTGGRVGKWDGRIGDTPVCGAGNWADARVAVSGTGVGEAFARRCAAKDVAARVEYGGQSVREAAEAVVFRSLAPGDGGVIAVGKGGEVAMPFNSPGMWRGCADSAGRFEVGVFGGEMEACGGDESDDDDE